MNEPLPSALAELPAMLQQDCRAAAELLNRGCACISLDQTALQRALIGEAQSPAQAGSLASRPHLFADGMVFVSEAHLRRMAEVVAAVERIVTLPAYRATMLARAPASARHTPPAAGVFLGYDFHIGSAGPQLIEINTNAGGALLNARLLRAQRACCPSVASLFPPATALEQQFIAMFRNEWRLARGDAAPLSVVAIVDQAPEKQYLAPEFELFRQLFVAHGMTAFIVDPAELVDDGERLRCRGQAVDLVYNRLTDFSLEDPAHAALRSAYLGQRVVLTPHPQLHALYADKRNLVRLGDAQRLAAFGAAADDQRCLAESIPRTIEVLPGDAERFWASRKQWFFKPFAGYGSKAAYRGDKLTRRVFEDIAAGGYVAQALVAPSLRRLLVDGSEQEFKLDLRNYVYRGQVQLVVARLYQGQTTNFRTPGGGFAAVLPVPCPGQDRQEHAVRQG
ncbi:MAG TPA: hypothetical protein PLB97_06085 [Accumulibacter sp.]|jgi:hypothetical protein|nr:hypothetical protein [Accumulibacter sp.]HPP46349.1 hypothetical protein [Accumulibacter sp.]